MFLHNACVLLSAAHAWAERKCWDANVLGMQEAGGKMAWTIIRPGGLKSNAPTGMGVLTEDASICGAINREDVAELVVKAVFSEKANGKVGFKTLSIKEGQGAA